MSLYLYEWGVWVQLLKDPTPTPKWEQWQALLIRSIDSHTIRIFHYGNNCFTLSIMVSTIATFKGESVMSFAMSSALIIVGPKTTPKLLDTIKFFSESN